MAMHTYTASGTYVISYLAIEYDYSTMPPSICFEKIISDTITLQSCPCSCPGNVPKPNLIVNGDFSAGNTGFSSTLGANNPLCTVESYAIGNDFPVLCNLWPAGVFDHTVGNSTGSFMMIDGGTNPTSAPIIWSQPVNFIQNTTYCFSFWTASVYCADQQNFDLLIYVNSYVNPTAPTSSGVAQANIVEQCQPGQSFVPTWIQHSYTWTCPVGFVGPYELVIQQLSPGAFTDFGLDDLCLIEDPTVGLFEVGVHENVRVYPNPNTGEFTIDLSELKHPAKSLQILDLTGQVLKQQQLQNNNPLQKIDAGELPEGMYIIQIIAENRVTAVSKFVKM
jgi:hypothetical protein